MWEYFNNQTYLIVGLAILLGSFPSAYLITKVFLNKNITEEGSGNTGAYNVFYISQDKRYGILTLLFDFLKGLLAAYLGKYISGGNFWATGLAVIFAIAAHGYNPWLKFKGGRGLATAAGAIIIISPLALIDWLVAWAIGYFLIKKDIIFANVFASFVSVVILVRTPDSIIYNMQVMGFSYASDYKILFAIMNLIIFIRHIAPFRETIKSIQNDITEFKKKQIKKP